MDDGAYIQRLARLRLDQASGGALKAFLLTIFKFNRDRLVGTFHQKSGIGPMVSLGIVVGSGEPLKTELVQHKQCRCKEV